MYAREVMPVVNLYAFIIFFFTIDTSLLIWSRCVIFRMALWKHNVILMV